MDRSLEGWGKRKGRPPTPGTSVPANRMDERFNDRGANSLQRGIQRARVHSGSDEEAGSRPSDELVLWNSSLSFGSSRLEDPDPRQIIGPAITICACTGRDVKTAISGPNTARVRVYPLG